MLQPKSHQLIVILFSSCLLVSLAFAADFWVKKPYQSWSPDEIHRMLEESPWAVSVTVNGARNDITGLAGTQGTGFGAEMETNPSVSYTVRFLSARPIREAQVRSQQLGLHYDAMSAEKKAAFDANAAKFLAVSFADRVVVSVTFQANVQNYEGSLRDYWATQSVPKLSTSTYLNAGSERLSVQGYSFQGDNFVLTFPRPKQIKPDDKISVEFVHPRLSVIGQQRILEEFSVKKMTLDGQPSF